MKYEYEYHGFEDDVNEDRETDEGSVEEGVRDSDYDGSVDNDTDGGSSGTEDSEHDGSVDSDTDGGSSGTEDSEHDGSVDTDIDGGSSGTQDSDHDDDMDVEDEKDDDENLSTDRFFYYPLEAELFFDSESKEKLEVYLEEEKEEVKADNCIDEDESDIPQDVNEVIEDVKAVGESYMENGVDCFKTCSKRKIQSVRNMCSHLQDAYARGVVKKFNPTGYRYIMRLLKPYRKIIKKLASPNLCKHEHRQILQKSRVGAGVLGMGIDVIIPALEAKMKGKL